MSTTTVALAICIAAFQMACERTQTRPTYSSDTVSETLPPFMFAEFDPETRDYVCPNSYDMILVHTPSLGPAPPRCELSGEPATGQ